MFKFLLGYQVLIEGIIPGIGVPESGFGNQVFLDKSPGLLSKVFCALFVKLGKNCRTCSLQQPLVYMLLARNFPAFIQFVTDQAEQGRLDNKILDRL